VKAGLISLKTINIMRAGCSMMLMLALTVSIYTSVFAETAKSKLITDIHGYWSEPTLDRWLDAGWLHGYDDKTVRPDQPISRGEFISLINRSFDFTEKAPISFTDLKPDEWEYEEAQKAVKAEYLRGYADNTAHVHDSLSRQEVAVIISRLLKLEVPVIADNSAYSDSAKIASWSKDAIASVTSKGIMEGYDNHQFRPDQKITRAEAVVVLDMALSGIKKN
jgi:hypothetical protein